MLPQTRYLFQVQSLCSSLSCPVRPRGSPEEGCKDGTRGTEWPTGCETSLEAPGLKVPRLEPCQHYFSFSASCLSSHLIRVCLWPTGAWWHSNCAVKADTCRSSAHSPWGVLTRCGECSLTVGWAHTCTTSRGELPLRRRRWRLYILCLVFEYGQDPWYLCSSRRGRQTQVPMAMWDKQFLVNFSRNAAEVCTEVLWGLTWIG